jgi:hypothetical protein
VDEKMGGTVAQKREFGDFLSPLFVKRKILGKQDYSLFDSILAGKLSVP